MSQRQFRQWHLSTDAYPPLIFCAQRLRYAYFLPLINSVNLLAKWNYFLTAPCYGRHGKTHHGSSVTQIPIFSNIYLFTAEELSVVFNLVSSQFSINYTFFSLVNLYKLVNCVAVIMTWCGRETVNDNGVYSANIQTSDKQASLRITHGTQGSNNVTNISNIGVTAKLKLG